jgi:putative oxygen-independent coproporphyrinogen III oxidase
VYIHVPFCAHRCDYCAFATWTGRDHLSDAYVAACRAQLRRARDAGMPAAGTVYIGGGTPSRLGAGLIGSLLDALARPVGAEVTVECNPEDVTEPLLAGCAAAGVTRLSFGVQSMVPSVLAALGRVHRPDAVERAVAVAAATGFGRHYSVDLIFGAAGETVEQWLATLDAVLALDPPPRHVSAYGLTVEAGTPLAAEPARYPDPDDQADKYRLADQRLADAGLRWYEVSNWAAPGAECRHNQLYWTQGEYLGVGCAAHSHRLLPGGRSRRWWNVRTPERYIRLVGEGASPEAAGEELDPATRLREQRQLALRTRAGMPVARLGEAERTELAGLAEAGLVEVDHERVRLTLRGRLLANEVAVRLCG